MAPLFPSNFKLRHYTVFTRDYRRLEMRHHANDDYFK